MEEDFDSYNDANDELELSNRFEQMLENEEHYFFDVEEFEDLIDFYLDKNEMEKAKQAIDFALEQHPNSSALKIKQAQYLIENHQPNKGLEILNALENMEPFNPEVYLNKANIYSQIRQHQKAIENYYKALKIIDDKTEKANIYFNIAFEHENLAQYDKALVILKDLLLENPENETVLYEISFCYNLKNDTESSIEFFNSFIDEH
ncbi:MAG TPA: tetratricopeptide repeat protein, partial [Vicingus sp.]|nr:tetratricopeptide repeat protein [Vicingus sp.]